MAAACESGECQSRRKAQANRAEHSSTAGSPASRAPAASTDRLEAGNYEVKVTISESWDENYGVGAVRNGGNIAFTVGASGDVVAFSSDPTTHKLTVTGEYTDVVPSVLRVGGAELHVQRRPDQLHHRSGR